MTTGVTTRALEVSCWLAGTTLLMLYLSTRAVAVMERDNAIAGFTQAQSRTATSAATLETPASRAPDQTRWSEGRRRGYAALLADSVASAAMPAAVLRIPSVQLEVPVYADSNERNLNRGAALVPGTALLESDGNIGIAGHRDGFFRALEDVAVGDVVEVESPARRRVYRVAELLIVEPTDTSPLRGTGQPSVTLVTCYPFYFVGSAPQRFIVRAVAVS